FGSSKPIARAGVLRVVAVLAHRGDASRGMAGRNPYPSRKALQRLEEILNVRPCDQAARIGADVAAQPDQDPLSHDPPPRDPSRRDRSPRRWSLAFPLKFWTSAG